MALHRLIDSGRLYHPGGDYQFDCACGAKFRSPLLSEAAAGFRDHMAPALPQRAEEGTP